MNDFEQIFLSWRKGVGSPRRIVGVIEKTPENTFTFKYLQEDVENAKDEGFSPYTGFPDTNVKYTENVIEVFSQRLTKSERRDVQDFYDFWEIEPQYKNDKFYLLGHTQGLLPIDNFEFLADYKAIPRLHFLTDLAGLSYKNILPSLINNEDILRFEFEKTNSFDEAAIAVYKDDTNIGYIKKVHCGVFHKPGGEKLKLRVKAVEKNGKVKKIFVKVFM